jgi:hypothetical protein
MNDASWTDASGWERREMVDGTRGSCRLAPDAADNCTIDLRVGAESPWNLSAPRPLPVLSTRRRTGIEPAWELLPPHRF